MAKKRSGGTSQSQSIRDYLAKNPDATASEIIPALAKQGVEVSATSVHNTRSQMKKKASGSKKATRKKVVKRTRFDLAA